MFNLPLLLGTVSLSLQIATPAATMPYLSATQYILYETAVWESAIDRQQDRNSELIVAKIKKKSSAERLLDIPQKPNEVNINKIAPLSLEEAIKLGINNNRQLAISRLELDRERANLSARKAARFPSLSTETTLNRSLDAQQENAINAQRNSLSNQLDTLQTSIDGIEGQLSDDTDSPEQILLQSQLQQVTTARTQTQTQLDELDRFAGTAVNGSVGLEYNLYSPERGASIDIAKEEVISSQLEVQITTEQLIFNITDAYYNLQQIDREVEIAKSDVQSRRRSANIVTQLLEASLATRLDLLNVKVELDNARQLLRNSQAEQEVARRSLADILSLSSQVTPVAADAVEVAGNWDLALEETIILGLKNRVELEQQLALRGRGKAAQREAYAAIKPRVRLFANYNYLQSYSDQPGDDVARGFGDGYSVGVGFNWTIWDGGAAVARARGAKAEIEIAEQNYADSAETIRLEIEQAYYQLPADLENVETASRALDRAEEAVTAANTRFRANLNTQTEVLDAQNRLIQAKNNLVQAIIGHNRSLASLQRAVGITAPSAQPSP